MNVHHIAIQVVDLERSLRFWRDTLALPEVRRQEHSVWVEAGGTLLMLERCDGAGAPDPWKSDRAGAHLIALAIAPDTRDAWKQKLAAAGVAVEGETAFTIYCRDPDGTRVGLSHYPTPA